MTQFKHFRPVTLALCCVLCLVFGQAYAERVSIAAVVGEDIITSVDVAERRDLIMATTGIAPTVENQSRITPRIVQSLIDETLQMQEAKRQSLTVSDEELDKAMEQVSKRDSGESVQDFIKKNGLSLRSLQNQLRAQLAWNKVVQRKLRRNVSISQDEILRAQQAAASTPGELELRIQALELRIESSEQAMSMNKLADDIALELQSGAPMNSIAARLISNPGVRYSQPTWVPESQLPPALQQMLRTIKTGDYTQPMRAGSAIQILQVMDRKTGVKLLDETEYAIKQITVPVPKKRDKASLAKLTAAVASLRANPGDCISNVSPVNDLPNETKFVRAKVGDMSPEQRNIVAHLDVGDISEPLTGPDAVRLVMVCEKIEPAGEGALPDAEKIRQQLFAEKIELEAEKHLRNLRRDAYIDIKGDEK